MKYKQIKNRKKFAALLYFGYALALTLVLILGREVSARLIYELEVYFSHKEISDVTVDISESTELLAGKYYYPKYLPEGDFRGSAGLRYESLDPEHLTVDDSGRLLADLDFEGDVLNARVRITSAYDDDFEKVCTFRFVKRYPDDFSISYFVKSYGRNTDNLYVGVPVFVFANVKSTYEYNVKTYELVYDKEYFTEGPQGSLIPIKATEEGQTLSFAIEYANGARTETKELSVIAAPEITDFDEIRFNGESAEGYVGKRNKDIEVTLYKDGKCIPTDYTITLKKTMDAKRDGKGGMTFLSSGEKVMTVTLPSGYSRTVRFVIENEMSLPILKDSSVNETHVIDILDTEVKTFYFDYDGNVSFDDITFESDSEIIRVSNDKRSFTVKAREVGTARVKLILDDEYTRLEDEFTVNVERDMRIMSLISKNVSTFVTKIMGHLTLFALLGLFAMNWFKFVRTDGMLKRVLISPLMALPVAVITEAVQYFIPGRIAKVRDVLIDMTGFYIGVVIIILYRLIVSLIKRQNVVELYEKYRLTEEEYNARENELLENSKISK